MLKNPKLKELILYTYQSSLVPEIFDLLGEEKAIEFLRIFGGLKIDVPKYQEITELARSLDIYETLNVIHTQETTFQLAERYKIPYQLVQNIYRSMKSAYPKVAQFAAAIGRGKRVLVTTKRKPRHAKEA